MNQIEPLLLQLNNHDFDKICVELNEEKNGTRFYYAIDTYDLLNYCFPFGLRKSEINKRANLDIEIITDEQFALFQLFNKKDTKILLLDEYVKEVVDSKRFVEQSLKLGIELIKTLKKYEESFYSIGKLNKLDEFQLEGIIRTKLSLIISTSIGIVHDGIDKLIDLFKNKKIVINGYEIENSTENLLLIESFDETLDIPLNPKIVNILKHQEEQSTGENENIEIDYHSYDRDAKVIDRIFKVNNLLEKKYKDKKLKNRIVILYLSSTMNSIRVFNYDKLNKFLPVINNKKFNPHRNIACIFLKSICLSTTNIEQTIENVKYLKERILEIKQYQNLLSYSRIYSDINDLLHDKFNYYRERFENFAIFNQYFEYQDLIKNAIKEFKKQPNSRLSTVLLPILDKLIEDGNKEIQRSIEMQANIDNWENQVKFAFYFEKAVDEISKGKAKLSLITGNDPINGIIHHLPIIYYFSEPKFFTIFNDITKFITSYNIDLSNNDLLSLAKNSFDKAMQLKPSLEERLIKAFVFLLIPKIQGIENTNKLALKWADSILNHEIIPSSFRDEIRNIEKDYRYFIGWVSRRCGDYELSINHLNSSIKLFPEDGRFYHGLCLAQYCVYEMNHEKESHNSNKNMLFRCIQYADKAYDLYDSQKNNLVIQKSQYTLLNTISYLYAELSKYSDNNDERDGFLIKAQELIDRLKNDEKDYQFFPEYFHTYSYIRYLIIATLKDKLAEDTEKYFLIMTIIKLYDESLSDLTNSVSLAKEHSSLRSYRKYEQFYFKLLIERQEFVNRFMSNKD